MNAVLYYSFLIGELIFLICLSIYSVGLLVSSIMGAPYVPTAQKRVNDILEAAHLSKGQMFLELGCGDGRIVRSAVKQYNVKGVGIEINPLLILLSRFWSKRDRISSQVVFRKENVFKSDVSKADCLYLFLMPAMIEKLQPRLTTEMKRGALVISHGFKVPGWEKRLIHTLKTEPFSTYYYRV